MHQIEKTYIDIERRLSGISDYLNYKSANEGNIPPNPARLKQIIELFRRIIFPEYYNEKRLEVGVLLEELEIVLTEQIADALSFFAEQAGDRTENDAAKLATAALEKLPEVQRLLYTDVYAMCNNDPAARSYGEVILCYPCIQAMTHYRVAHELLLLGIPVIPRIITELAHSTYGIDIHPAAQIGEYFSIDHGTGVVIGETCIIGSHVHLYQGVTLGARSFTYDERGNPLNVPRHPIIEDNVVIYSNSTVLGRITIGHDSVIGGNVWLTNSVPPYSRIIQHRASTTGETRTGKSK
ncbi:MAG: serine acetyltransferase [Tannerella sp.]|jgi:serine O-acetyltransferase|nr:serine acetyltransferase [Tannerella sp.]